MLPEYAPVSSLQLRNETIILSEFHTDSQRDGCQNKCQTGFTCIAGVCTGESSFVDPLLEFNCKSFPFASADMSQTRVKINVKLALRAWREPVWINAKILALLGPRASEVYV